MNGCECYKSQKVDTKYKRGDFKLKGVGWIGGLLERGGGARGGVATWDWRGRKRPIMASSYTWHPRAEVDIKQQWKPLFQWEISPMRRVSSGISSRPLFHIQSWLGALTEYWPKKFWSWSCSKNVFPFMWLHKIYTSCIVCLNVRQTGVIGNIGNIALRPILYCAAAQPNYWSVWDQQYFQY